MVVVTRPTEAFLATRHVLASRLPADAVDARFGVEDDAVFKSVAFPVEGEEIAAFDVLKLKVVGEVVLLAV